MGCLEASKWPNNYSLAHTEAHLCGPSSTSHPVYYKSMKLADSHLHIRYTTPFGGSSLLNGMGNGNMTMLNV